jgi:diguanylate cyclase (GGDEF)-like protein
MRGETMIEISQYIEVNLIGIVQLLTILIIDHRNHSKGQSDIHQNFISMIIINTTILLLENSIYLLRGISSESIIAISYILCCTAFILHTWFGMQWFCYVIGFVYPRYQLTKSGRIISALPAAAASILIAMTPFNGWIFSFSHENLYSRGPCVFLTFLVDAIYLVTCTVLLIKEYLNPNAIRRRSEYLGLLYAPLPILIGCLLQICVQGLSAIWIASAVSLTLIYLEHQNEQSSRDALTGLYNRRQTDAQLSWELARKNTNPGYLVVSMIDIDEFKKINDTYGHVIGDEALICVADTLMDNFRKTDFIGRYGGDEFLMIGHIKQAEDAERIFKRLKHSLDTKNRSGAYPYSLSVSIGYVVCDRTSEAVSDDILKKADERMYEVKARNAKRYSCCSSDYSGIISQM